jgi:hypothetical protein
MGRLLIGTMITSLAVLSLGSAAVSRAQEEEHRKAVGRLEEEERPPGWDRAQEGEDEVGAGLSVRRAMRILREEGLAPRLDRDWEPPRLAFKVEGDNMSLSLDSCEGRRCLVASFVMAWTTKLPVSRLNEWNKAYRYAKAYINTNDQLQLEYNIYFVGPDASEQLRAGLARWRRTSGDFKRFAFQ